MAKICYNPRLRFGTEAMAMVLQAEAICDEYSAQGFTITLRQLYYQFVARGLLANNDENYDRLGDIVSRARMKGLIDWNHVEDRTRHTQRVNMWDRPQQVLTATAAQYRENPWNDQPYHLEVWVEKEALAGVVERPANRNRVTSFCCRGYVSQSSMQTAAQRLNAYSQSGKITRIIHLGDHDPSGVDMTRDVYDRLNEMVVHLGGTAPEVRRVALNMEQVRQYNPPPNPAKLTDSRAHGPNGYIARYGDQSWELDALDPPVIDALIQAEIDAVLDSELWASSIAKEEGERATLQTMARHWGNVVRFVTGNEPEVASLLQDHDWSCWDCIAVQGPCRDPDCQETYQHSVYGKLCPACRKKEND